MKIFLNGVVSAWRVAACALCFLVQFLNLSASSENTDQAIMNGKVNDYYRNFISSYESAKSHSFEANYNLVHSINEYGLIAESSAEMDSHPAFDKLLNRLDRDPMAIAAYVQNKIALYGSESTLISNPYKGIVTHPHGIMRSASRTLLEGQGTAWDQCALLVTLLRKAGYKAGYAKMKSGLMSMTPSIFSKLSAREQYLLSKCQGNEQICLKDGKFEVAYPWVCYFDEGTKRWIELFPWYQEIHVTPESKHPKVEELLSDDCINQWIQDYLYPRKGIEAVLGGEEGAVDAFSVYLEAKLKKDNLGLDDIVRKTKPVEKLFKDWEDFKIPVDYNGSVDILANLEKNSSEYMRCMIHFKRNHNGKRVGFFGKHYKLCELLSDVVVFDYDGKALRVYEREGLHIGLKGELNKIYENTIPVAEQALTLEVKIFKYFEPGLYRPPNAIGIYDKTFEYQLLKDTKAVLSIDLGSIGSQLLNDKVDCLDNLKIADSIWTDYFLGLVGERYHSNVSQGLTKLKDLLGITRCNYIGVGLSEIAKHQRGEGVAYTPFVDILYNVDATGDLRGNAFMKLAACEISINESRILKELYSAKDAASTVTLLQESSRLNQPIMVIEPKHFPAILSNPKKFIQTYFPGHVLSEYSILNNKTFLSNIGTVLQNGLNKDETDAQNNRYAYVTPYQVEIKSNKVDQELSYEGLGAMIFTPKLQKSLITDHSNKVFLNGGYYGGSINSANFYAYKNDLKGLMHKKSNTGHEGFGTKPVDVYSTELQAKAGLEDFIERRKNGMQFRSNTHATSVPKDLATCEVPMGSGAASEKLMQKDVEQNTDKGYKVDQATPEVMSQDKIKDAIRSQAKGNLEPNNGKEKLSPQKYIAKVRSGLSAALTKVADPINVMSGAFYADAIDLELKSKFPLTFTRSYSSASREFSSLGLGWQHNLNSRLLVQGKHIEMLYEDGSKLLYTLDESDQVYRINWQLNPQLANLSDSDINLGASEIKARLVEGDPVFQWDSGNGRKKLYKLLDSDQTIFKVIKDVFQDGSYHEYKYEKDTGLLIQVKSSVGGSIKLDYNAHGLISEVYDSLGRSVSYEYDSYGNLIQVKDYRNLITQYTYKENIEVGYFQLEKQILPSKDALKNHYDSQGRVVAQSILSQEKYVQNAEFIYKNWRSEGLDFQVTSVKDIDQNVTQYQFVEGLLYKVVDPKGAKLLQSWYLYDAASYFDAEAEMVLLNPSPVGSPKSKHSSIDKRGLKTLFEYDDLGNIVREVYEGELTGDDHPDRLIVCKTYRQKTSVLKKVESYVEKVCLKATHYIYSDNASVTPIKIERYAYDQLCGWTEFIKENGNITGVLEFNHEGEQLSEKRFKYENGPYPTAVIYHNTGSHSVECKLSFSQQGMLQKLVYPNGTYKKFGYLLSGDLEFESFYTKDGQLIDKAYLGYDEVGRPVFQANLDKILFSHLDPQGNVLYSAQTKISDYTQDHVSADIAIEDLKCLSGKHYQYDLYNRPIEFTDPDGNKTYITYNSIGQIATSQTGDMKQTFLYEAGGLLSRVLYGDGDTAITHEYTTNGQLKKRIYPDGTEDKWIYDLEGRVVESNLNNQVTHFAYDDVNNAVEVTDVESSERETYIYDITGSLSVHINSKGESTSFKYDSLGRMVHVQDSAGKIWQYAYDDIQNRVVITMPNGAKQHRIYTAQGDLHQVAIQAATGGFLYNRMYRNQKNLLKQFIDEGAQQATQTTSTYCNTMGNPIYIEGPRGDTIRFKYHPSGRLAKKVYNGNLKNADAYTYDALGRLSERKNQAGPTWKYHYNSLGLLGSITEPDSTQWEFEYNKSGLLKKQTAPNGSNTHYHYGKDRNLKRIDAGNESIEFKQSKDTLEIIRLRDKKEVSRVKQIFNSQGKMISEAVTLQGKQISSVTLEEDAYNVSLGEHQKAFAIQHNDAGWLMKKGALEFKYDIAGRLVCVETPNVQRHYVYKKGELDGVVTNTHGQRVLTENLSWNKGILTENISNGQSQVYTYDKLDFLESSGKYKYKHSNDTTGTYSLKQGEDWFREGPGRTLFTSVKVPKIISGEAENAKTLQVSVNGQLKHHFPVKGKKRWSAEVDLPAGQSSTICARAYDFEGLFEEDTCSVDIPHPGINSEYDSEGRLVKRSYTNGKNQTFEWNAWGQLEKMVQKDPEGNNYTFTAQYDPLGRRIQTTFKDQLTTYVYNPEVEFETLGHQDNTSTYWHHQSPQGLEAIEDSQGTITTLINNAQHHGVGHIQGQKVVHYGNPTPYGKLQAPKGPHQTYRGKPYDPTGLIYMGARYYDPGEAQFLTPDPYGYTSTTNLYAYANGDPINYYDPDGRLFQPALEVIGVVTPGSIHDYGDISDYTNLRQSIAKSYESQYYGTQIPTWKDIVQKPWVPFYANWKAGQDLGNNPFVAGAPPIAAEVITGPAAKIGKLAKYAKSHPQLVKNIVSNRSALNSSRYGRFMPSNEGAYLPKQEILNFIGNSKKVVLREGAVLYGIRDMGSRKLWWTRIKPNGMLQWRMDQAVLKQWNKGTHIETLIIPEGKSILGFEGSARGQSWYLGGGNQIYIPKVPEKWTNLQKWR